MSESSASILRDGEESISVNTAIFRWADRAFKAEQECNRLRAELDVINKSHADLAHRLADLGRENERLREAAHSLCEEIRTSGTHTQWKNLLAVMPEAGTTMGRLEVGQGGAGGNSSRCETGDFYAVSEANDTVSDAEK